MDFFLSLLDRLRFWIICRVDDWCLQTSQIDILGFWATQWNFHKIQTDYGYSELKKIAVCNHPAGNTCNCSDRSLKKPVKFLLKYIDDREWWNKHVRKHIGQLKNERFARNLEDFVAVQKKRHLNNNLRSAFLVVVKCQWFKKWLNLYLLCTCRPTRQLFKWYRW